MTDDRRPPARGVMGFVAALQQMDVGVVPAPRRPGQAGGGPPADDPATIPAAPAASPTAPVAPAASPTAPVAPAASPTAPVAPAASPTAPVAPPVAPAASLPRPVGGPPLPSWVTARPSGGPVAPAGPAGIAPGAGPAGVRPGAEPSGAVRRRWAGLLIAGALAAVVAGGVGYAAVRPDAEPRAAVLPGFSLPAVPPGDGPAPPSAAGLAAEPVRPSPSRSSATAPATPAVVTVRSSPAGPPATVAPDRPEPQPVPTTEPAWTPPPTGAPGPTGHRLTAAMSGGGEWVAEGLLGYGGSVRLDNAGQRVAGGWRVVFTVPGGNPVHGSGNVTVVQDGELVTFAPGPGGAVPPGGSMTFDFWIGGVLPARPYGCMVDGHPCS